MKRRYMKLDRIEHEHPITKENDKEFLYHLQNGLLLALKERGVLNLMEFRHAQEKLNVQRGKGKGL